MLLLLNTVGGDIEAGLAIAEMVVGMTKPTVTLVLGGGHSIGIPLAVSGRETFIVPSASMTVHPVRMTGLMIAAPQSYRYFERVQESIVSFVARHSRITEDAFRQLMLATGICPTTWAPFCTAARRCSWADRPAGDPVRRAGSPLRHDREKRLILSGPCAILCTNLQNSGGIRDEYQFQNGVVRRL